MRKFTDNVEKLHEAEAKRLHEAKYEIAVKGQWGTLSDKEEWVEVKKDTYDKWGGKKREDGKVVEKNYAEQGDKFEQTWKSTLNFQDEGKKPVNTNTGDKITIKIVKDPNTFEAEFQGRKFTITSDELAKFKRTK